MTTIMTSPQDAEIMTAPEACELLRIAKPTLWDKCRRQEIPHIRYNARTYRFRRTDLELWLKERSR